MQCDLDINSSPNDAHLKWSFGHKGLLTSDSNLVIDIPNSNVQVGTVLQVWSTNGGDNQVWIASDAPDLSGFVLRCKDDPNLVLENSTVEVDNVRITVQRYTGSIWQHWTLTPEGYLASTATDVSGKMMVLDVVGKLLL